MAYTDSFLRYFDDAENLGKKMHTRFITIGADDVHHWVHQISDSTIAGHYARVLDSSPAGTEDGLVTRPIMPSDPLGANADALVAAGAAGSISAKFRRTTQGLEDLKTLIVLAAGTNNIGDVDVLTLPALSAGTNNIGDVDVLTLPADPLGANADAIVTAGAAGTISAKLRRVSQGVEDLKTTISLASGANFIGSVAISGGIPAGANTIGNVGLVAGASAIGTVGVTSVPADPFGANADAGSQTGSISAKLRYIAVSGIAGMTSLPTGTNTIGGVNVITQPADPMGTNADAIVAAGAAGSMSAKLRRTTQGLEDLKTLIVLAAGTNTIGKTDIVTYTPKVLGVSGSIGITTAATWDEWVVWAIPGGNSYRPKSARSGVTTAGSLTLILAGKSLGTFNPNTNAFVDGGSVSSPDFYNRVFYRITTTHSATATNVTLTYVNQDGTGGRTTGALVIPASAPAGNWYEFILQAGDYGIRDVTAVVDTAAPTSVVDEIWGVRTLLESNGPANTLDFVSFGERCQLPTGESIVIILNAAAVTAQQRFAQVIGDLV